MISHFQGKSFLKEVDFSKPELETMIQLAAHFKYLKQQHIPHPYLQGKNIALLFEKKSSRTRSSFTVAANDLGAHAEFLGGAGYPIWQEGILGRYSKSLGPYVRWD